MTAAHSHDPLQPRTHDPNPDPPDPDPSFILHLPGGAQRTIEPGHLNALLQTSVPNCYIVSTGHGTSGPFTFSGVQLIHLLQRYAQSDWDQVEVVSGDGFGNRIYRHELERPAVAGPIILATRIDGLPLSRQQGLVRLIVPTERDDALRQVKWVAHIRLREPIGTE